jgi:adenosylcobinamide-GDP ribazoletransferase
LLVPPIAALQFLTLVPPIVRHLFTPSEMGWAVGYFPLVGALLGGLLALLDRGLSTLLPAGVVAALLLLVDLLLTGALHLDGFLDSCDGLLGGHTPEARLEIMRDERMGAFGVAGGILALLLKHAALTAMPSRAAALICAATAGRWAMTLAVVAFPYGRVSGLGRALKDHAGPTQAILASVIALAVVWLAAGWWGLGALAVAGALLWLTARYALARLPGLTGDIYGAICILVEVVVLIWMIR